MAEAYERKEKCNVDRDVNQSRPERKVAVCEKHSDKNEVKQGHVKACDIFIPHKLVNQWVWIEFAIWYCPGSDLFIPNFEELFHFDVQ